MNVSERDAVTIGDAVRLLAGFTVHDSRGRAIDRPREYSTNRAYYSGSGVNSYGSHFPLFRYVPRDGRHGPLFLINGDSWTGPRTRTPDHQAATRRAIAATGVPAVVIPFTALEGAGLLLDSVRIVDVRPDETWTETRTAESLAGMPRHARTVRYPVDRTAATREDMPELERTQWRELTPDEITARDADRAAGNHYSYGYGTSSYGTMPVLPSDDGLYRWTEYRTRDAEPDADGLFRWEVTVHRLGECVVSAVREIAEPLRPARPFEGCRDNGRERVTLSNESAASSWCADAERNEHEAGPSGACVTCGETLTARPVWRRRARYLSGFDTNEVPPLYFLAELPRGTGDTVAAAFDALAPRAVHAAMARGLDVLRQGDIFLIPTGLTAGDLEGRGIRSRARLTQWTRDARARKGETGYSAPLSAADRRELSRLARRTYRRARAELEPMAPRSDTGVRARFARLRENYAAELAERREDLRRATFATGRTVAPYSERGARLYPIQRARERLELLQRIGVADSLGNRSPAMARDAYRHGRSIYAGASALELWRDARRAAHARLRPELYGERLERAREDVRAAVAIYGTAHSATEVIRLRSGAVYVRGTVRHVPTIERGRFGNPDHAPIYLGDGERWYLAVRNAVPRQATARRARPNRGRTNVAF